MVRQDDNISKLPTISPQTTDCRVLQVFINRYTHASFVCAVPPASLLRTKTSLVTLTQRKTHSNLTKNKYKIK